MIARGSTCGVYAEPPRGALAHLPGEDGWPIVGNTLAALKDPVRDAEAIYHKYGPVYRDHLFWVRSVGLLGREALMSSCFSIARRTSPRPAAGASSSTAVDSFAFTVRAVDSPAPTTGRIRMTLKICPLGEGDCHALPAMGWQRSRRCARN